jgi:hypothetical protein
VFDEMLERAFEEVLWFVASSVFGSGRKGKKLKGEGVKNRFSRAVMYQYLSPAGGVSTPWAQPNSDAD